MLCLINKVYILGGKTMKKLDEMKTFVKEHKNEIIAGVIGVGVTVGSIAYIMVTKKPVKIPEAVKPNFAAIEKSRIEKLNWRLGDMTDLWNEGGHINTIINDITMADLGKLGDELIKIEGVTMETGISIIASIPGEIA